ncbi:hypothetical protein CSC17_1480 [Klebsiella oxytoca]|nr:hypothetical protein CSC17_1480 [Klebsiella oxytoca]
MPIAAVCIAASSVSPDGYATSPMKGMLAEQPEPGPGR